MYAAHSAPAASANATPTGSSDAARVVGEPEDPDRRERHPHQVERPPREDDGESERAGDLERHRDAQRDAVHRLVDAQVHGAEREPEDDRDADRLVS